MSDDRGSGTGSDTDTGMGTVVHEDEADTGASGQRLLASGATMAMRLWDAQPVGDAEEPVARDYETVGYVVSGRVELTLGDQVLDLGPGASWVVPQGAVHSYRVVETVTAVEATSPPGR